jgi:hypothetical protein
VFIVIGGHVGRDSRMRGDSLEVRLRRVLMSQLLGLLSWLTLDED